MVTSSERRGRSPRNSAPLPLEGRRAIVTGATSGIGRAIALALADWGAAVCGIGRDAQRLQQLATEARERGLTLLSCQADLIVDLDLSRLRPSVEERVGTPDILVHSAGVIHLDALAAARITDLDDQYASNLRAPYRLTQLFLPDLKSSRGDLVFINSSVGLSAKRPDVGQYAAMHHGLRAIADSLREEVNPDGVRVLTVHVGKTATPRQARLHEQSGLPYHPELLLQPEDVAEILVSALALPRTAEVTELVIRPRVKT